MINSKTILIIRIVCLCSLAFLLIGSYALSRPAVDSLFLQHYSTSQLPSVWLLSAVFAAVVMTIYNRYNTRFPLLKIFGVTSILSGLLLTICLVGYQYQVPGTVYVLYLWKEIYIVLLIEIFWSFADVVFSIKSARWIYGILLGVGSAGGLIGNLLIGPLAKSIGTANSLWWVLPILFLCWLISTVYMMVTHDPDEPPLNKKVIPKWQASIDVVRNSKYLVPLLFLVCTIQICISLIDYQFNGALLLNYPDIDIRTDIIGKTHAVIDLIAVVLQFGSGTILKFIGVSGALMCIPLILSAITITFILVPRFFMIFAIKVASKCFDYSLFRTSKEILYIPLEHDEKIQGKALIDILVYRIAKGLSSIILLALVYLGITDFSIYLTLILLMIWIFLTLIIVKRYGILVNFKEDLTLNSK